MIEEENAKSYEEQTWERKIERKKKCKELRSDKDRASTSAWFKAESRIRYGYSSFSFSFLNLSIFHQIAANCYEESNNNEAENYLVWRLSKIYLSVTRVHIYISSNAGVHEIYTKRWNWLTKKAERET